MKTIFYITILGCASTLVSYWDYVGSASQVPPPVPTTKAAEENRETKSSEATSYTVQKNLLASSKTRLEYLTDKDSRAAVIEEALERVRKLPKNPIAEPFLEQALNNPDYAVSILEEAEDQLESWYGNLPASD